MGGWVNRSEAAINVVIENKRKMLSRLGQNGMWSGSGAWQSPDADDAPPAESCDLPTSGISTKRGKPVVRPQGKATRKRS